MCLAIPMKIVDVDDTMATCEAAGVRRRVSLQLVDHLALTPGDFVLVHLGYAIQVVSNEQAAASREAWDALMASAGQDDGGAHA